MNGPALVVAFVQLVELVLLAPLLIGVIRQTKARIEGRIGSGVLQPWRDIRKLLVKDPVRAERSSPLLAVGPIALLVTSLLLCVLLPLVGALDSPLFAGDLVVVVSIMLLGAAALALIGLDGGTAFGGMGSSRHMTIAALVEPTILLAVYALSVPAGTSALGAIVRTRLEAPLTIISPVSLLALVALAIAITAEAGRLPVDNPSTHLELTMVHEAMLLEASARDLAFLEMGSWLKLTVLLGLLGNLIAPWGMAIEVAFGAVLFGVIALAVKVLLLGVLLGAGEVLLAKLRLFQVPEMLAGSFVLALLAVTASYLALPR